MDVLAFVKKADSESRYWFVGGYFINEEKAFRRLIYEEGIVIKLLDVHLYYDYIKKFLVY